MAAIEVRRQVVPPAGRVSPARTAISGSLLGTNRPCCPPVVLGANRGRGSPRANSRNGLFTLGRCLPQLPLVRHEEGTEA